VTISAQRPGIRCAPQFLDRCDDPQPLIGACVLASRLHPGDDVARLVDGIVAVIT
jgi:hypothetical protein